MGRQAIEVDSARRVAPRYATRAAGVEPSRPAHEPPGTIMFGSGDAYPEGLPDVSEFARRAAIDHRTETLQYAPRFGLPELREWIAGHLAEEGGAPTAEQVLVLHGAKQGIDLVCKLFLDPGDALVVTRPTYQSALGIFRGWEIELVEVGMDGDGMIVDELVDTLADRARRGLRMPKLIYDVPEFHNPTGVTLSAARRQALLELAERHDLYVVEDDPYRRVRFEGAPVPPIRAGDRRGRVIGLGTFAKLVAPGLRVGWVAADPDIVGRLAALKADGGSCPFTQRILIEYCRAGLVEPDIQARIRTYRAHRDVMAEAVREQLPRAVFNMPRGGYYLWLRFPETVDTDRLAALAEARGVHVLPGSQFHAVPGPRHHLRLAYSYASPSEIPEGVRRLARALEEMESRA
jgi:2-aminoadipate transaminase